MFSSPLAYLSHLTHLTHLELQTELSPLLSIPDDVLKNTIIQHVAKVSPTLRHFRLGASWLILDWLTISRNEDGSYKEWHFAGDQEDVSEVHWAGFFLGAPRRAVLGF
jgi:hypothetical protein